MDRLSEDASSESLDFLDDRHLLLTFESKQLFQRKASCPPTHQDRIVHAIVLDLVTKAPVKQAEWYLHDRRQYVWPFGPGQVLLRKLNDLYVVDANLNEKLLWSSPKDLLWVTVTPDASQIVIETSNDSQPVPTAASGAPSASPVSALKYEAQFLNAKTLKVERNFPLKELVSLSGSKWGYVDLVRKNDVWLIRFGPNAAQRKNITRVRSVTLPTVLYTSDNSLLVGRCAWPGCQYPISSFSLTGRRLWRQQWPDYRWFPTVRYNADSSRFAVSALRIDHNALPEKTSVSGQENPYEPDLSQIDAFQQQVKVLDTATGDATLAVPVHPALMAGGNFAVSPDGLRLAAIEGPALELFDVPASSQEERAEFATLKTDIPNFYAVTSSPDLLGNDTDASKEPSADGDPNLKTNRETPPDNGPEVASGLATPQLPTSTVENATATTEPTTTIKVNSRAVLVDVVVTDKQGHPIHGLTEKDFRLTEDGTTQEIRFFQELNNLLTASASTDSSATNSPLAALPVKDSPAKSEPPKPSSNTFSNETKTPEPGAVTLVLFDVLNTPAQDQVYAREQLVKFLKSKPANMEFALCMMSGGSSPLHMIQGFTSDETLLLAAAKGNKDKQAVSRWQGNATSTASDVDTVGELSNASRSNGFQGLLSALQRMQAEEQTTDTDQRVAITVNSLMMLSRYLAGIHGRKNVVWLSGSFPISLPSAYDSGDPAMGNRNYSPAIKAVTNLLAEAQVAVYPVDVRGLRGFTAFGAEGDGSALSTQAFAGPQNSSDPASITTPQASMPTDANGLAEEAFERASLTQVANATGGRAFFNVNGIANAIETAVEEGANYYTLSYTSSNKNYDGKFRKIKVALDQKGYTLHYRQGYFAVSGKPSDVDSARRARVVAMQHGSPPSRQLLFSASVIPVGAKRKVDRATLGELLVASNKIPSLPAKVDAQHYSVDYTFKASDLRFTSSSNTTFRNSLILMISSYDQNGKMLSAISSVGVSELPAQDYHQVLNGNVSLHQDVDIPVDAKWLRLGIQDQISNNIGTVEFSLPLPALPNIPRKATELLPEIEPD